MLNLRKAGWDLVELHDVAVAPNGNLFSFFPLFSTLTETFNMSQFAGCGRALFHAGDATAADFVSHNQRRRDAVFPQDPELDDVSVSHHICGMAQAAPQRSITFGVATIAEPQAQVG